MTLQPARATLRRLLAAFATLAVASLATTTTGSAQPAAAAGSLTDAGPPYEFTTELMDGRQVGKPLTGVAIINRTVLGYVYRAGSQDNHLVVSRVKGGLRFADSGTPRFKHLAPSCRKVQARRGVAAVCRVPDGISEELPLLVEVWPRIGDDFLDTTGLPATFAATMLGDLGKDVAHFGPGPDFFNGHTARDRVRGGGGDDWIRTGDGDDVIAGGAGDDYLVGMLHRDLIRGGDGDDHLVGMDGDDRLYPGAGTDLAQCGNGNDTVEVEGVDTPRQCERITLY
jgi:hypothetical protein